ncbi:MAG: histidinol dehydrogenase [Candidatus Azobacteroides sp.]|nr:histidinol dehydrogenase [Candidatus Azobacteroides sp.]
MQIIKYPHKEQWSEIIRRPAFNDVQLLASVREILYDIQKRGQEAIVEYARKFDKVSLDDFEVSEEEKSLANKQITDELKQAIQIAKQNIAVFHSAQKQELPRIETLPGVTCWQKMVPIEKVGLYIPGGTAPLFSTVLMLAVPAQIAGCREIILCTPPNPDGTIHPAILYAAQTAGVSRIFKIGGIQAIGAMAYGGSSIPQVYKIFGPGNRYVTAAKQVAGGIDVAIDLPAGPSEVAVIADYTANPAFVASDLLSQAEHGPDSQALLLTDSEKLADQAANETAKQLEQLPRKEWAEQSLKHSKILVLHNQAEIIELANLYAPEHLIIETENYHAVEEQIINAGSVFLGHYAPESAGDYASGTNHTLPTNGHAKAFSGVNLDSFVKKITFQEITREGIRNLAPTLEIMAENEHLHAHKNAVSLRIQNAGKK